MTVASNNNRVSYSGNGSTTAFAFAYPFRATSDLVVNVRTTSTGAESLKVEGSDYTVSGTPTSDAGGFASGTVTFSVAPASGTQVHIDRVVPPTQGGDFIAGDGVPPSLLEGAVDRLTLVTQELDARFARTLLQPRTAANRNLVLPEPSTSVANSYLRVNPGGTGFELSAVAPDLETTIYSVASYGAVGDGVTEDHLAIQAAIDAASTAGGGTVYFPSGTYLIGATLTLKSKVILQGQHYASTTIKAKDSLNADMVKTLNYSTLTGQNKYLIADGVQYGFGLYDIGLDGNKANQASGNGLVCYGKKYRLHNVVIRQVKGIGWVSEGWYNVNTATFPEEPESHYENIDVQNCGSHGIQYRGPTDAHWQSVFSHQNTGWGIRFESDGSTYNCASDLHFAHVYANVAGGVFIDANTRMRVGHLGTESNSGVGLQDTSVGGSTYNFIESYFNCSVSGTAALILSGSHIKIGQIFHNNTTYNINGAEISGTRNTIKSGRFKGDATTGTGIVVSGTGHRIECEIDGYSGAGGKGIQSGSGGTALTRGRISAEISDCKTGYSIQTAGVGNHLTLTITAGSGQTVQSAAFSASERGAVAFSDTVSSFAYNINAPTLLQQSAAAAALTGTTTETALATISIPGNAMGANGSIVIHSSWSHTNSANNKNARARIGGISGTVFMNYTDTTTATLTDLRHIANRNATNSQAVSASNGGATGGFGASASTLSAPAQDTTANFDIVLTGQLANSGETITLESYRAELIRN